MRLSLMRSHGACSAPRDQRGAVLLILVLIVSFIAFTVVFGPLYFDSLKQSYKVDIVEAKYLDDLEARVTQWYELNASVIDANASYSIATPDLLAAAGMPEKSSLVIAFSDRITSTNIKFRRIAIWLRRSNPDASTFAPATGNFTAGVGVPWRLVDGEAIQLRNYDLTLQRAQLFASQLTRRFQSKFEADPLRSLSVNYFRPISGTCVSASDDMPCIDVQTQVAAAANWTELLSIDPSQLTSAWGAPFTVSNLADSNITTSPYTMAIRSPLPWGGSMLVNAVQPLN